MSEYMAQGERLMDQEGHNIEHFLEKALDSLIDDLFDGEKVGGLHLDDYVEKFSSEISRQMITNHLERGPFEKLIRRELEDSTVLHDRAAELAQGD